MIINDLKGKQILFISPIFYDYHLQIINKLTEKGADVFFFPERKYNWQYSFLRFLSSKFLQYYQSKYYSSILKKVDKIGFDYFFVIKGSEMPVSFINRIKEKNLKIKAILYQWDSLKSIDYKYLINNFDKVYTFDPEDANRDARLRFLPLFCTSDLFKRENATIFSHDLFYVASYTFERYKDLIWLLDISSRNGYRLYHRLLIPRRLYYREKFLRFRKIESKKLFFTPLSRKQYLDSFFDSNIIIDSSHSSQSGLTMRAIETIAMGKKLLTTNPLVEKIAIEAEGCVVGISEENINNLLALRNEGQMKHVFSLDNWLDSILMEG